MSRVIRLAKRLTPPPVRVKVKSWLGEVLAGVAADHQLIARTDAVAQLIDQKLLAMDAEARRLDQGIRSAVNFQRRSAADINARTDSVVEVLDQRLEQLRIELSRSAQSSHTLAQELDRVRGQVQHLAVIEAQLHKLQTLERDLESLRANTAEPTARIEALEARLATLSGQLHTAIHENRAGLALKAQITGMTQQMAEAKALSAEAQTVARRTEAALKKYVDDAEFVTAPGQAKGFRLTESDYREFERQFRGGPHSIVRQHRQIFNQIPKSGKVLDLGCGSGILVKMLRDAGIEALGIDSSQEMVDTCRRHGLPAARADAIGFLREQPAGAFDTIVSVHMIEHLSFNQLCELVGECHRVLPEGGKLILESPNVASLLGWSRYYTLDPTHREPRHPALIRFLCERAGFSEVLVDAIHPPADDEKLTVPGIRTTDNAPGDGADNTDDASMEVVVTANNGTDRPSEPGTANGGVATAAKTKRSTERSFETETVKNFQKLNDLFFSGQDYIVRGTK